MYVYMQVYMYVNMYVYACVSANVVSFFCYNMYNYLLRGLYFWDKLFPVHAALVCLSWSFSLSNLCV